MTKLLTLVRLLANGYATWVASFDNTGFVTFQAIGENFVPSDFSNLADA